MSSFGRGVDVRSFLLITSSSNSLSVRCSSLVLLFSHFLECCRSFVIFVSVVECTEYLGFLNKQRRCHSVFITGTINIFTFQTKTVVS